MCSVCSGLRCADGSASYVAVEGFGECGGVVSTTVGGLDVAEVSSSDDGVSCCHVGG